MTWKIVLTKSALKDLEVINRSKLKHKVVNLIEILKDDPFQNYPSYEKLSFNLKNTFSRRINLKHRLVYQVFSEEKTVKILRMWTHYDES